MGTAFVRQAGDAVATAVVHIETRRVAGRLDGLGLTEALLRDAVDEGVVPVLSCTANDPDQLAGILGWGKITRALRDRLVRQPHKWQRARHRGQDSTVKPDGSVAVVVAGGTEATGTASGVAPATRSTKGPATRDAVARNWLTFSAVDPEFEKYDPPPPPPSAEQTWLLLYYIDHDAGEVRAELSLPESIDSDDHVTRWRERILLESIPLDEPRSVNTETDEDDHRYEVPVTRAE